MTLDNFRHVINEIKPYTEYIYLHIKGEPLLHSKFKEIIKICDEQNIKVNITTNGILLNKQKSVIEESECIRQINISLHGHDEDEFEDIFETVDYLNKKTSIYFVYRYWTLSTEKLFSDTKCLKKLASHYDFSTEKKLELENNLNIKLNETLYVNKDNEFEWPSLDNEIYKEYGTCYGLKTHIGILSDGTVVPCCLDAEGSISLGNVFKESLKSILEKQYTKMIIEGFKDNKRIAELCKHCNFKK